MGVHNIGIGFKCCKFITTMLAKIRWCSICHLSVHNSEGTRLLSESCQMFTSFEQIKVLFPESWRFWLFWNEVDNSSALLLGGADFNPTRTIIGRVSTENGLKLVGNIEILLSEANR